MEFLKEEYLKSATPYMLRNDGKLIECSPMHPYIKYNIYDNNKNQIEQLFNLRLKFIEWFYNNTQHQEIKEEILNFISNVINSNLYDINNIEEVQTKFNLPSATTRDENDIEEQFLELNNEMNQEFCRVRTSNMRLGGTSGDTYFRISSANFNWFDIIQNIVLENQNFITSVSISTDTQSRGGRPIFYSHNGIKIFELPTDEFLTLSGNPIIESNNYSVNSLMQGKSLMESFDYIHPGHVNNCFNILFKDYCNKYFKEDK